MDYLPMAKPVTQIITSGYAVTVCIFKMLPVAGSPSLKTVIPVIHIDWESCV